MQRAAKMGCSKIVVLIRADTVAPASKSSSYLLSGPPLHNNFTSSIAFFSISFDRMLYRSFFKYEMTESNSFLSSHIP